MAATVNIRIASGAAAGTVASAETGIKYNRDDTQTGTTAPIPIPVSAGTNYSWYKTLYIQTTAGGGSTSISQRKVSAPACADANMLLYWNLLSTDTYVQATSGNCPVQTAAANNSAPTSAAPAAGAWTAMSTTPAAWDTASVAAADGTTWAARNGKAVILTLGIGNSYAAGASTAAPVPTLTVTYDEA